MEALNNPYTANAAPGADGALSVNAATENWDRYKYVAQRGHREYTIQAQICERMYLGAGRQWDPIEAAKLVAQGRRPREFNDILPSVNAAIGHQIKNRMDIQFRARGGAADQAQADIRSKVIMQIADQQHLHWKETEVFGDGLIQQRGYYDVRMDFTQNMQGNLKIVVCDPMDVIPDPDAKTYEPSGWADVIYTRWLTKDDIEGDYGADKAAAVFNAMPDDQDFGMNDDTGAIRAKFSDVLRTGRSYDAYFNNSSIMRARVVERQRWVNQMSRVLYYPRTGDFKLAENLLPEVIAQQQTQGAVMTKRVQRRVKWVASTCDVTLHDDWSPYDDFTIVPYFAYFRRGQTIGLVDNAIDPQQARNKAFSNFEHILGSTANGGWITQQNSITNMKAGELEAKGAMTGLHIEVRADTKIIPQKIQPTQLPTGIDRYLEQVSDALKAVTVPDAMRGQDGVDTSGIARQTQQFAAQQQIAIPLDNLGRTRHMLAEKMHKLTQQFMSEERTFRITETSPTTGQMVETPITVNQYDPATGTYTNDMTEGEYDVVVAEQPMAMTFEEGQFNQAMEMRKNGVAIPDAIVVQSSSLSRKGEIVSAMEAQQPQSTPLDDAKTALASAQTTLANVQATLLQAQAVNADMTAMFSATQAANQIVAVPGVAPLADALLKSAGFVDKDAGPIVPNAPAGAVAAPIDAMQSNTSPNFPARPVTPDIGAAAGIEKTDPSLGAPR